jgi:Zn finger protein HypA/HybF involved in hydrogenase expression
MPDRRRMRITLTRYSSDSCVRLSVVVASVHCPCGERFEHRSDEGWRVRCPKCGRAELLKALGVRARARRRR